MNEFTKKDPNILNMMKSITGKVRVWGKCATCSSEFDASTLNGLYYTEYKISGMCSKCQDQVFGGSEGVE